MTLPEYEAMIVRCLEGIDSTECSSNGIGWWETTGGAEFGKQKLEELLDIVGYMYLNLKGDN